MSPLTHQIFEMYWKSPDEDGFRVFQRSMIVGEFVADLVRTHAIEDTERAVPAIGDWFVHAGVTRYRKRQQNETAYIELVDGSTITDTVRAEYRIASTAIANMTGLDDISTVVGRRISDQRFELVCAGYRDPMAYVKTDARTVTLRPAQGANVLDLDWRASWYPNLLGRVPVDGPPDGALAWAIADTLQKFAFAIEQSGAWRLLYEGGVAPSHETRHQKLFEVFSRFTFTALGIHVYPNVDNGRGPTDFVLEYGGALNVVEFKKDSSPAAMKHGLEVQLGHYMTAAGAERGTYVVLCHKRDPGEVLEILSASVPGSVHLSVVDCRPRPSASVA
jgi:hypothetical protein